LNGSKGLTQQPIGKNTVMQKVWWWLCGGRGGGVGCVLYIPIGYGFILYIYL
jgi:hypothetical protein